MLTSVGRLVKGLLSSQAQRPAEVCRVSNWPLVSETSPFCGTSMLCPVSCCSMRTAPFLARMHIAPEASSPTSVSIWTVADGNRVRLNLRGVDGQRRFVLQRRRESFRCPAPAVSDPPDFKTEKCAGPQMVMWPPSTSSMRAWPAFTWTSLPLRRTVFTLPLHHVHTHRAFDGNGFAFDCANLVLRGGLSLAAGVAKAEPARDVPCRRTRILRVQRNGRSSVHSVTSCCSS